MLLCGVTIFGCVLLTLYRPPVLHYLLSVLGVGGLFLFSWKIPNTTGKKGRLTPWTASRFGLFGFFSSLTLFLLFGAGPPIIGQPLLLTGLGIALVFTIFSILKRFE